MAVEEINVVQMHAPEALVQACHQVLSGAPVAVWPQPHVIACLRRDEEFIAIRTEVVFHQAPQGLFCRTVGRAVVVGEIEVCDAVVEGITCYLTTSLIGVNAAEVVPEAETDLRQQDARLSASVILHSILVAQSICCILFHIVIVWGLS